MADLVLNIAEEFGILDYFTRPHCDPRYAVAINHPYIDGIASIDDIRLEPANTISLQWKMLHFKVYDDEGELADAEAVLDIAAYNPPGSSRVSYIAGNLSNPSLGVYLYRFQMPEVLIAGRWYIIIKLAIAGSEIVERVNFEVVS